MNGSDLRNANICYGCGEEWEHANKYNHLCSMCRYDYNIGRPLEELEIEWKKREIIKDD